MVNVGAQSRYLWNPSCSDILRVYEPLCFHFNCDSQPSSSSSGADTHLYILTGQMDHRWIRMINLTYYDWCKLFCPALKRWLLKQEFRILRSLFSTMPAILLRYVERAKNGKTSRSSSYVALWLLCLNRAECFPIQVLSELPSPSHQTAPSVPWPKPNWTGTAHCSLWAGAAFPEINERDSVFLQESARSCQLYACWFTWLLKDVIIKFHSRIHSASRVFAQAGKILIYQSD